MKRLQNLDQNHIFEDWPPLGMSPLVCTKLCDLRPAPLFLERLQECRIKRRDTCCSS